MDNREIDNLVAQHVMGFKLFTATKENTAIINGSRVAWGTWVESGRFVHEWGPDVLEVKRYSADISAAWDVVEKIKEQFVIILWPNSNIVQICHNETEEYLADVKTNQMQLSICLAALKAVGAEAAVGGGRF